MTQGNKYDQTSTITAIATPPGEGGVAIIRISGRSAIEIGKRLFSKDLSSLSSHTLYYGKILDTEGQELDRGMAVLMRAPSSYTGEDTVEIHCHGGILISQKVLNASIRAGARLAAPGEFTYRAFFNQKIDLIQAEAVQSLIAAKNDRALDEAEKQLRGKLSLIVKDLQKTIADVTAIIEAWVDYPEEGLEYATSEEIEEMLKIIEAKLDKFIHSFHDGKRLTSHISLCLLGMPNVGKSSLMNALVGHDRAIVTHIPGTTRDLLEEQLSIGSYSFRLIDTAGIRTTDGLIEQEGIRRSKHAAKESDLILFVLDLSRPLKREEISFLETLPKARTLLVWNKCDLKRITPPSLAFPHQVKISVIHNRGIEELKQLIEVSVFRTDVSDKDHVFITHERHFQALKETKDHIHATRKGFKEGISPEFLSFDLRQALKALSTIIGTDITEDILSGIFSKFCVGK